MAAESVERPVKAELCYRLKDALETNLITSVSESDTSRATVITVGKYASDIEGIVVSVYPEHPIEARSIGKDQAAGNSAIRPTATYQEYKLPVESLGGSNWRTINATVQIRMLKDESPEDSVNIVEKVIARVKETITTTSNLRNITDPWGHTLFYVNVADDWGYASGGEDTTSIIHWVNFTALEVYTRTY